MQLIQIVLLPFLFFALSRVFLRYRDRQIKKSEFLFWTIAFLLAITGVSFPDLTTKIAHFLGIGRGADLIVYGTIVIILYLIFRAYVLIEDLRREITLLVRQLALRKKK